MCASRRVARIVIRAFALAALLIGGAALRGVTSAAAATGPILAGTTANATSLSGAAYLAVSGNYAYTLGFYAGTLTVVDISNPSAPQVVGQSPFASSLLNGSHLVVSGSYAYVVSQNRNGPNGTRSNDDGTGNSLTILDISNPTAPTIVGSLHNSTTMFGPHGVAVSGSYVYVAAQGCLSGQPCPNASVGDAFVVIDASNPSQPRIVASIRNANLPSPWTGTGALKHACSITISGNYAYVTASYTGRLTTIDISDPLHPAIVSSLPSLPLPVDVAVANGYAYIANENSTGPVTVVDVRSPTSPVVAGSVSNSTLNGAYRIRVRGNFAYVAATYATAMAVIDISNPANPRLVSSFTSSTLLNRTVGIDLDPSAQYVISSSPWLSTETRTLYPPFPLQPGGPTATGTVNIITLDPSPIGVTISSHPASTTTTTTATFAFSASDAVSSMRCQLDGAPAAFCTTPTSQSYSSLLPGTHTFTVQALDSANRLAAAGFSWTITTQPPANTKRPQITGTVAVGQQLQASPGTWTGSPAPTFSYQWKDCDSSGNNCSPISGATGSSYTVTSSDVGSTLLVSVTATNSAGSSSANSPATSVVSQPAQAPSNSQPPQITGTVAVGQQLQASPGTWTGSPAPTFSYQWKDCDSSGNNCSPISGATGSSYTVTSSDVGSTLLVSVTATNSAGSSSANSPATSVVSQPAQAPSNSQPPQITGTVAVGQQLQASPGTWTGSPAPTFSYQWKDCDSSGNNCSPISGATGSSYTVTSSDVGSTLLVSVTATNSAGSSSANSPATSVVSQPAQAPSNSQPPQITGTVAVGQQLQASPGTWTGSPAPTFSYQWKDCDSSGNNCSPISGATGSSYTVTSSDVGSTLLVSVTATNSAGSSSANSPATSVVSQPAQAPSNSQPPQITGTVAVGQQLQASPGTWTGSPAPTFSYQWKDCDSSGNNCSPISGATGSSYTVTSSDVGSTLLVSVTATNSAGSSSANSPATSVVSQPAQAPSNSQPPQITGTVAVGQQLQASPGTWTGSPAPTFSYQWKDCDSSGNNCSPISGATGSSYTVTSSDVGSTLLVSVTATNSAGSSSANSPATSVVSQPAQAPSNSQPPQITGTVAVGQQLQASPGTWTGSPAPTFSYQWKDCDSSGNNCSPISGATGSSYTVTSSDVGSTLLVSVTATNSAGSSSANSPATSVVSQPAQAPSNSQPPQITGTVAVGQQLQASPGTWTGSPAPTFSYQWKDCDSSGNNCSPISGATGSSYTVTSSDVGSTLLVSVTATNSAGSSSANSPATSVVSQPAQAPSNSQPPQITGTVAVGQQLQASPGTWTGSPAPTFSYQWKDCDSSGNNCSPISGATGSSYTVTSSDVGSTLLVSVTATNSAGSSSANSPATSVVSQPAQAPSNSQPPQITGTVAVGQQLQASPGTWTGSPAPTFSYQWKDCDSSGNNCSPISGATGSSYTVTSSDVGSTLLVSVTATNSAGSSSANSPATSVVSQPAQAPSNSQPPQITGTVAVGQQLQASPGTWTGSPAPTFSYQWKDCDSSGNNCSPISGATGSSYTVTSSDVGSTLLVSVTATNSAGSSSANSPATVVVPPPSLAPKTPVLDNFNRANGSVGANWTVLKSGWFAAMNISAGVAVNAASSLYAWDYWNAASFGPDVEAYATVASYSGNDVIRIGARVTVTSTSYSGYFVSISATGVWSIIRMDNGNPVTLATGPTDPISSGDQIAIRIVGSVVTALHNTATGWRQVVSYNTAGDAIRYTSAGRLALEFRYSTIDNFGGGGI